MPGFYKSVPFDQALTQQLILTMQYISSGSPNAINAVRALEGTVFGYICDDEYYKSETGKLTKAYSTKMAELEKTRNKMSDLDYSESKQPIVLEYTTELYKIINVAMLKKKVHPMSAGDASAKINEDGEISED